MRSGFYTATNYSNRYKHYEAMEEWLIYSLISCLLYSIWTIFNKLSSSTIDSTTSNLIQLPVRTVVTLFTAFQRMNTTTPEQPKPLTSVLSSGNILTNIGNLNLYGTIYTFISCIASVFATFFLGDALEKGGSASSVAIIAGSYPALSYVLSVIFGLERLEWMKVLGVFLAVGSCYCFAQ